MDHHTVRFIILALVIAVSVLRAIRRGTANRPRSDSSGRDARAPGPTTTQSPIEPPASTGTALAAALAATGVFVAGNVLIWGVLFALPALGNVPTNWRLVAGVVANLVLIALARSVAARIRTGTQTSAADDNNPIK